MASNPRKRLTKKQAALARARVKHPDASQSEIGDKVGMTQPHVARELSKPHVKARVQDLMNASPALRVGSLLKKLEEGLNAEETKFFSFEGEVTDERECIDFPTRHRYLETALELQGLKGKGLIPDELPDGATFTLTITT